MRGPHPFGLAAPLAGLLLTLVPERVAAQGSTELHVTGSTVAQPKSGAWLSQDLSLGLSEGPGPWPRVGVELQLYADRADIRAAFADIGSRAFSVRVGRFRLPVGHANALPLGEDALVSPPLALDDAFAGRISATGAVMTAATGGFSLRGGLTDGLNTFFGGGQIGIVRAAWLAELPWGFYFSLGGSGATNQIAGLVGADASAGWRGGDAALALGGEAFAGSGNWRMGPGPGSAGYGQVAVDMGPHQAAFRWDQISSSGPAPARTVLSVAYGLQVAPRAVCRLEIGRDPAGTESVAGLQVGRAMLQLVFGLGGPASGVGSTEDLEDREDDRRLDESARAAIRSQPAR